MNISQELVRTVVLRVFAHYLSPDILINNSTSFLGINSSIKSIEAVQIIAAIEDQLEEIGVVGYDLFDKVFSLGNCSIEDLILLISEDLTK